MRDRLTGDVCAAEYLVDLSNVVRDASPPSLVRLARLLDALADRDNDDGMLIYLVADQSLFDRHLLSAEDRREITSWQRAGLVDVVGDADERLLELAGVTGLTVISSDRFRGHRAEHPWLQGNTEQFLKPHVAASGQFFLQPVDLGVLDDWEISRHAEGDLLKKQGLLAGPRRLPRYDILERAWRCPDYRCSLYDHTRGTFVMLPRVRSGKPTCEIHHAELVDNGPRPSSVQLKLHVDGTCVERFTIPADAEIPVGRAPASGISLAPWLDTKKATMVSRHHFSVLTENGQLVVRDQSTNGTKIFRNTAGEITLRNGAQRHLAVGESVSCCAGIALTRSGRKFPSEIARDNEIRDKRVDDAPPTRSTDTEGRD